MRRGSARRRVDQFDRELGFSPSAEETQQQDHGHLSSHYPRRGSWITPLQAGSGLPPRLTFSLGTTASATQTALDPTAAPATRIGE